MGKFKSIMIVLIRIQLSRVQRQQKILRSQSLATYNQHILANERNIVYSGFIQVGTPPQLQKVVFDTGSYLLWVGTSQCVNCGKWQPKYRPADSKTFKSLNKNYSIYYVTGDAFGVLCRDQIKFQNFTVNFKFMATHNTSNLQIYDLNGIMGLDNGGNYQNIFQIGFDSGQLISSMFAFQLGKYQLREPSYFYYNISQDNFKQAVYVNTTKTNFWNIPIYGLLVQDNIFYLPEATIDSGTSFIIIPLLIFLKLNQLYFEKLCSPLVENDLSSNARLCYCQLDLYPDLIFRTKGIDFKITPQMYLLGAHLSQYCYLGIQSVGNKYTILGDILFQNYIVIFDKQQQRIGFIQNFKYIVMFIPQTKIIFVFKILQALLILSLIAVICTCTRKSQLRQPLNLANVELSESKNSQIDQQISV